MIKIAAVILAAGFSRRMGDTDKLTLEIYGRPMIQRVLELVCRSDLFEQVIVVTNQPEIQKLAQRYGAQAVENPNAQQGQGTSVAAGTRALAEEIDCCMYLTADQPCLTKDILYKLTKAAEMGKIIVPHVEQQPKSPCIFPKKFFGQCKALSGEKGGKSIYKKHMEEVLYVDFPRGREWKDIDTMEDYNAIICGIED